MEFKTDDVRKAFSKGNVVFAPDGISVSYTYKDDWVSQTLGVKPVFERLLSACSRFSITIKPNEFIRFLFSVELPLESAVFYPAMEKETEISLDDLIASITPEGSARAAEFFYGADFNNESAVLEKLSDLLSDNSAGNLVPLYETVRFEKIRRLARVVLNRGFYCNLDVSELDADGVGFLNFTIDDESHIPPRIDGDLKSAISDLMRESGYFGFECSVQDGLLILSFSN